MYSEIIGESFTFHLRNIELFRLPEERLYKDVISPFSRMYLINEGSGSLIIGNEKIKLEAGSLYFIPSFTRCTYQFSEGLSHYYIHFSIENANGINPFDMYSFVHKRVANQLDKSLFSRLLEINPSLHLPNYNPNVYQSKFWLNKKVTYNSVNHYLETVGMLKQLFSRFPESEQSPAVTGLFKYKIQPILVFIQENLNSDICVNELAEMACFSKDHFSRIFKSITGMSPCDYIIEKRIEKAQLLLLTTDLAQKEIIEQTGFKSTSYFSRMFKTHTNYSPANYRLQKG